MDLLKRIHRISETDGPRIACCCSGEQITYQELERRSNCLAAILERQCHGNKAPILVYGHKSPRMLTAFLGAVKSGRAYCPVDCSVPQERVEAIARQLKPSVVLADLPLELPEFEVKNISCLEKQAEAGDERCSPENWVMPEDLFYLIFTSGSTGTPKGVQITRSCLEHYLDWSITLGTAPERKLGQIFLNQAPFSFDLSVMDLYTCLASGGTLWMLEKSVQENFSQMMKSMEASHAQVWVSTPSFAELCLSEPGFSQTKMPELELFLFCGETLAVSTAAKLKQRFPNAQVVNTYGPTESTVAVTDVVITAELLAREGPLPVGKAKPGTAIEIWDQEGNVLPEGETGEIVILGNTVSTGYFGAPELTRKAFFQVQRGEKRLRGYHTGDAGHLEQGMLYYSGRMDLQVKLHGYRIELGDIEENLTRLPEVEQAVVVAKEQQGKVKSLAAFVVWNGGLDGGFATAQQLKQLAKQYLPDYMIPKKILFLDHIPMTPNGKADRKRLKEKLL